MNDGAWVSFGAALELESLVKSGSNGNNAEQNVQWSSGNRVDQNMQGSLLVTFPRFRDCIPLSIMRSRIIAGSLSGVARGVVSCGSSIHHVAAVARVRMPAFGTSGGGPQNHQGLAAGFVSVAMSCSVRAEALAKVHGGLPMATQSRIPRELIVTMGRMGDRGYVSAVVVGPVTARGHGDQGAKGEDGRQGGRGSGFHGGGSENGRSRRAVAFAAMAAVSVKALMKTAMCEGDSKKPQEKRKVAVQQENMVKGIEGGEEVGVVELFSILEGEWWWLVAAIGITLAHTLCGLAIPGVFSAVMEACRNRTEISVPIYRFVTLQVGIMLLDGGRHYLLRTLGERIKDRLRLRLYSSILQQEIGFFDANGKGELMSMLGEDVSQMQMAVTDRITSTLQNLTTVMFGAYKVLSISPKATLLVVLCVPILSMASMVAQGSSRRKAEAAFQSQRLTAHMANEVITNARTVQSFCAENKEAERYTKGLKEHQALEKEYRVFTGFAHLFFGAVNLGLSAGGLWFGGSLVKQGLTTPEQMMEFMQYSWKIGGAIGSLMSVVNEQQKAVLSAKRVFNTISRTPLVNRDTGESPEGAVKGRVELKNLSFSYPTRPTSSVISEMNLVLEPGTVTALVGGSGNGKSTVAWLLQRFYDPTEGMVTLDGRDLRDLNLTWLRGQMAIVSQEPMLFHGTVADNIRYGCPTATDAEVEAAAKEANAHEFVDKLSEGYQTVVSQVALSAGQRQRISIARAILKNPRILILDEATSQLDAKSEGAVQAALDRLMMGRTVLVIAHRLSTVKNANNICVLEGGQIIEAGTHDELMRKKGLYALMANRQMAGGKTGMFGG